MDYLEWVDELERRLSDLNHTTLDPSSPADMSPPKKSSKYNLRNVVHDEPLLASEREMNQDRLRTYENLSYSQVLDNKRLCFSPAWVRNALGWCAKHQVSAHCLPQGPKELIAYMDAVGWTVSDSELFEILAKKLLAWTQRWITNEKLSPAMVETKRNPTQRCLADWDATWADYTLAWIDPAFDFVLGQTSVERPKGTPSLPSRKPHPRSYKAIDALVEGATEYLECVGPEHEPKAESEAEYFEYESDAEVNPEMEEEMEMEEMETVAEKAAEAQAQKAAVAQAKKNAEALAQKAAEALAKKAAEAEAQKAAVAQAKKTAEVQAKKAAEAKVAKAKALEAHVSRTIFDAAVSHPLFEDWHYGEQVEITSYDEAIFESAKRLEHFKRWWQEHLSEKKQADSEDQANAAKEQADAQKQAQNLLVYNAILKLKAEKKAAELEGAFEPLAPSPPPRTTTPKRPFEGPPRKVQHAPMEACHRQSHVGKTTAVAFTSWVPKQGYADNIAEIDYVSYDYDFYPFWDDLDRPHHGEGCIHASLTTFMRGDTSGTDLYVFHAWLGSRSFVNRDRRSSCHIFEPSVREGALWRRSGVVFGDCPKEGDEVVTARRLENDDQLNFLNPTRIYSAPAFRMEQGAVPLRLGPRATRCQMLLRWIWTTATNLSKSRPSNRPWSRGGYAGHEDNYWEKARICVRVGCRDIEECRQDCHTQSTQFDPPKA
ncbi:uncharacterized protein MYCGRDRAFT_97681 [Zymoseptoria tritici IPO323]|uniref:Uncharacterized protein n=1 Tax=Zymoseptoria tritici (strain CBS 115943 / IPO323) TaxID=336722 RepID=F9XQZ5_ZYMTI|nr:uncharacterized protein MYCGRDRAFT_97681 [Zymoseptoria tritici IPO323]EGP82334.1 hypothetical protein MYCGRDRAFT_97681 [Zymoseptoria tritici IPO323]